MTTRKMPARAWGTFHLTRMVKTARVTATGVAVAALLIGAQATTAATPQTTSAGQTVASTCGPSVNPNRYIPRKRRHNGPATWIGNTRIQLRYGDTRRGGPRYYWAQITGAGRGDRVTLYWDIDYGSWRDSGACSATVHSGGGQNTRAVKSVHGHGFYLEAQACGHHADRIRCTPSRP
ncbi:hypothetical protein [Streptomyces sp. ME18-1-4]|uniref:hypothetical protein n=1 Tax=Streptomyces sp. ME18-1-4 TaxID=3028685 RepID=UPI00299FF826|nr:hypothetical protein [Streptomyces sp. ME18-1-4]MDX3248422.1 hypothetical protein [Streptomyces sp. ME18-1-4]